MATASPKSPILAVPSVVSHTLPGFRSRCTTPLLWANSRPRTVWVAICNARSSESLWSSAFSMAPSTPPPPAKIALGGRQISLGVGVLRVEAQYVVGAGPQVGPAPGRKSAVCFVQQPFDLA